MNQKIDERSYSELLLMKTKIDNLPESSLDSYPNELNKMDNDF